LIFIVLRYSECLFLLPRFFGLDFFLWLDVFVLLVSFHLLSVCAVQPFSLPFDGSWAPLLPPRGFGEGLFLSSALLLRLFCETYACHGANFLSFPPELVQLNGIPPYPFDVSLLLQERFWSDPVESPAHISPLSFKKFRLFFSPFPFLATIFPFCCRWICRAHASFSVALPSVFFSLPVA